jgi:hypothetical protein
MIEFKNTRGESEGSIVANNGSTGLPFLAIWIAGPAGPSIFLSTTPGTSADLRRLADELDAAWQENEARTYAEQARRPEVPSLPCTDDARYLDTPVVEF